MKDWLTHALICVIQALRWGGKNRSSHFIWCSELQQKISGCMTLPKYHIQISQQLQPPKKTFSEHSIFQPQRGEPSPGPRQNPSLLTKGHTGGVRCREDVPVEYSFLDSWPLGKRKQKNLPGGTRPLHSGSAPAFSENEWDLLVCESKAPRGLGGR